MSARTTIELTREVRDVLVRSTITETSLTLPPGQLERKLYEAVNKVLVAAGGKWNKSAKAHIFQSDPRGLLGLAVELGEITDKKKLLGQYYTPDGLADRMAKLAKLQPDDRLLDRRLGPVRSCTRHGVRVQRSTCIRSKSTGCPLTNSRAACTRPRIRAAATSSKKCLRVTSSMRSS